MRRNVSGKLRTFSTLMLFLAVALGSGACISVEVSPTQTQVSKAATDGRLNDAESRLKDLEQRQQALTDEEKQLTDKLQNQSRQGSTRKGAASDSATEGSNPTPTRGRCARRTSWGYQPGYQSQSNVPQLRYASYGQAQYENPSSDAQRILGQISDIQNTVHRIDTDVTRIGSSLNQVQQSVGQTQARVQAVETDVRLVENGYRKIYNKKTGQYEWKQK